MAGSPLIIGASGMVGLALYREALARGIAAVGTCHSASPGLPFRRLDLTDPAALDTLLRELRPSAVLVPAAQPNVDLCERDPAAAHALNVAPWPNLIALAHELDFLPVFFSTDYVFDGRNGPYAEDAAPTPINRYGAQKLAVEELLRDAAVPHLVIRTANVYGPELVVKNYALRTAAALAANQPVRAATDMFGTPTFAPALAADVWDLIARGARGVLHVSGRDFVDRYAYARAIAQAFDLDPDLVTPVQAADLGMDATRPLRAGLDCARAEALLGRPMASLSHGLAALRSVAPSP